MRRYSSKLWAGPLCSVLQNPRQQEVRLYGWLAVNCVSCSCKMFLPESSVLFLLLLSSSCMVSTLSRVSMGPDGGYRGIVVKIDSQMDQDYYQEIIDKIKVKKPTILNYYITFLHWIHSFFLSTISFLFWSFFFLLPVCQYAEHCYLQSLLLINSISDFLYSKTSDSKADFYCRGYDPIG